MKKLVFAFMLGLGLMACSHSSKVDTDTVDSVEVVTVDTVAVDTVAVDSIL